jgi:integrase/recombinase XerD
MANKKVGIFVRVNEKGKQKTLKAEWIGNARLKPVPGGAYWLKWLQGTQQKYHRVGSDPNDAVAAQLRRERLLAGENPPEEAGKPNRQRLSDAIGVFLLEKSEPRSKARWRWDLDQFASVCGRTYLDEIDRGDIFKWMAHFQAKGSSPRTVYNRASSIGTFLKHVGVKLAFTFSTRKKGGDIPNYVDPAPDFYTKEQLANFFAACSPEEKVRYLFFLFTGCREREVTYACWSDLRFAPASLPGEDPETSIFVVQPKLDLKFSPKTSETRDVPIDDKLVKALKAHRAVHPSTRLIFTTAKGKPEGHFLAKLKAIALRAGVNCGQCKSKRGKSCATHPVCNEWTLHKFRRTWATLHLRAGVSTYELQDWIGHSDQEMLKRYAKNAGAQSAQTWRKVNNTFSGLSC